MLELPGYLKLLVLLLLLLLSHGLGASSSGLLMVED
jgi:hypothetical protein